MVRTLAARLADMADAITEIEYILRTHTYESFAIEKSLQWAVERGLEIISEASRAIPDAQKAQFPTIPWPRIAGLGNMLRHEYQHIEPRLIWNIARENLGELGLAIDALRA
ncbi:MAG: DUF86 domain-containing protein [Rickettsiales bacterium]